MDLIFNQQNRRVSLGARRRVSGIGTDDTDLVDLQLFDDDLCEEDSFFFDPLDAADAQEREEMPGRDTMESVGTWLKEIYGDRPVPPFEVNATTMEALQSIMKLVEDRRRGHAMLLADAKACAQEYRSEREQLEGVLSSAGLALHNFSAEGREHCVRLAAVAGHLGLRSTSQTEILCALERLEQEEERLASADHRQRLLSQQLRCRTRYIHEERTLVRRMRALFAEQHAVKAEKVEAAKKIEDIIQRKYDQYQADRAALAKQLEASRVGRDCMHDALIQLEEQLSKVRTEAGPLLAKVNRYKSLPPDTSAAMHRIAEARDKLQALERTFRRGVQEMQIMH